MPLDNLGQTAYRVVEALSVCIGPRPAGGVEEKRAIDYLVRQLGATCQEVRRLPVTGLPALFSSQALVLTGAAFLAYCVDGLVEAPSAMLIYLVTFFALPKVLSEARKRASAGSDRRSENLIGIQLPCGEPQADLIVCAHLDSAKANRVPGELWPRLQRLFMTAMLPLILSLSVAAALRWLDVRRPFAPVIIWQVLRAVGLTFALVFLAFEVLYAFVSRGRIFSPGANDNASGVGVVLALAQHFQAAPPSHLQMHYVLFTAEELGLVGSQRFVKQARMDRKRTYVINLDMVGSGKQLRYVRGSELFPPRFTDSRLNALLKAACPTIRGHYYWMGNSDFHPFLANGFRAASLDVTGDSRAEDAYHTERDTLDLIDIEALQMTAETVSRVVQMLDSAVQ
jgi:hypothetical protein